MEEKQIIKALFESLKEIAETGVFVYLPSSGPEERAQRALELAENYLQKSN